MSPNTRQDLRAKVQFLKWQEIYQKEKPFNIFLEIPPDAKDQRKTNLVFEDVEISVKDMRGDERSFALDSHGFMVTKLPAFTAPLDTASIRDIYLPAVERLVKEKVEGADHVFLFDWRVRLGDDTAHNESINLQDFSAPLKPTNTAHIDTSAVSALKQLKELQLNKEAEDSISRVRIINVWRPVYHPVVDWSLAICDGSSVDAHALVETDIVRVGHLSSNLFVMHRTSHCWFYLPQQKPEEVFIFKQFDTDFNVQAKYCPHTSFKSPIANPDAPGRQSIEVRAIVVAHS